MNASRERKVVASLQLSHKNCPRVLKNVNDNFCVKCVTGLKDCACVSGKKSLNPSSFMAGSRNLTSKSETVNLQKGVIPNYCHNCAEITYVKDVSCVVTKFCKSCHKLLL